MNVFRVLRSVVSSGVGNYNAFMSLLKQRLNDNFIQNWVSRLANSSRALFYRSNAIFQFQPYLEKISVFKFCQDLSKLRMSTQRLEVEAGRWKKTKKQKQIGYHYRIENVLYVKY